MRITARLVPDIIREPNTFRPFIESQISEFGLKLANSNLHVFTGYTGKSIDWTTKNYETDNQLEAFGYYINRGNIDKNMIRLMSHPDPSKPKFYNVECRDTKVRQTNMIMIYNKIIRDNQIRTYNMYKRMVTASDGSTRPHNLIQIRVDGVVVEFSRSVDWAHTMIQFEKCVEYKIVPQLNLLCNPKVLCPNNDQALIIPEPEYNLRAITQGFETGCGKLREFILKELDNDNPKSQLMRNQLLDVPIDFDSSFAVFGPGGVGKSTLGALIYKF
eukprot:Lithocolla_globosa_v1_NODE_134_length_5865_cov_11.845465.p3 type:complete len:273 gc:universal NODE_134_length_5865_cov_11.845465:2536-3354(+)